MEYITAYNWMQDNASKDEWNIFIKISSEEEAIDYAQALGATKKWIPFEGEQLQLLIKGHLTED